MTDLPARRVLEAEVVGPDVVRSGPIGIVITVTIPPYQVIDAEYREVSDRALPAPE